MNRKDLSVAGEPSDMCLFVHSVTEDEVRIAVMPDLFFVSLVYKIGKSRASDFFHRLGIKIKYLVARAIGCRLEALSVYRDSNVYVVYFEVGGVFPTDFKQVWDLKIEDKIVLNI